MSLSEDYLSDECFGAHGVLVKILDQQLVQRQVVGFDETLDVRTDRRARLIVYLPL